MKNNKLIKLFLVLALVISSALGCVYAFSFRNMTLDFVQISDTHITNRADTSYKALSSSKDLLKDAINQINNMKGLDFVLFTGDMVDNATEENFENYYTLLKRLKYPSLNAFGNHDFYGNDKETVLDIVKKNNPNYTFNDTYYAFSPKTDYRIIILDSTIKDANTANGELSQEQLDFLDSELAQNKDKIVLIAMHHPSVEPFASSDHTIVNANQFFGFMKLVECFASQSQNIQIFFTDFFGINEVYNTPGTSGDPNWTLRLPSDFENLYKEKLSTDEALNLPLVMIYAMKARGWEFYKNHQELLDKLENLVNVR